ncbi:hypothetical protein DPMN_099912 [Dreissena polymorpha]|uniref:Uncharacterized protein n=1 Tax=Dreissena polymorpha TaxID=45954 RepID=A0A9D4LI60_DREPO|nr:hypothetical protein DPMN_099912 [Dreissena polymorpha]
MDLNGSKTRNGEPSPPYEEKGAMNLGYNYSIDDAASTEKGLDKINADKLNEAKVDIELEEDPWKISEVYIEVTPWNELSACGKFKRVTWDYFGKLVVLVCLLYLFICSLDFLGNAFKLIGGKAAGEVFKQSDVLSNPVSGLMIVVPIRNAIPMVMGANIGTSITNTLVSIGQISNKGDFRRAFAGATVHDMFNWITVLVLLPLEVVSSYLFHLSDFIVDHMPLTTNEGADREFLTVITHPFTKLIIQVDSKVIEGVAQGDPDALNKSMIKHCCKKGNVDVTYINTSTSDNSTICLEKCKYMFEGAATHLNDATIGGILLLIALVLLCTCLVLIVKTLNSLLRGKVSLIIKKFVNANFPGCLGYFTGYLAILIGTGLTILVQSSSVFTSALTPLVGIGVIELDRMYPLTLGSNIGTTTTAILAAFAQSSTDIRLALQIALCHLFFNLTGILLFFPIPKFRFPINLAKFLGNQTAKYRWFAIMYLILVFFLLPAAVFALSVVNWIAMVAVLAPILLLVIVVVVINILQSKAPMALPMILRNWYFLPEPLRSLKPMDRFMQNIVACLPCCAKKSTTDAKDEPIGESNSTTKL